MNGTFSLLMSTNEVYRDTDRTRWTTLDLEDSWYLQSLLWRHNPDI